MSFEIWSLVNRVQELSVTIGWLRRENAQAKVIIEQLLTSADCPRSEELERDWAFSCQRARNFLLTKTDEQIELSEEETG